MSELNLRLRDFLSTFGFQPPDNLEPQSEDGPDVSAAPSGANSSNDRQRTAGIKLNQVLRQWTRSGPAPVSLHGSLSDHLSPSQARTPGRLESRRTARTTPLQSKVVFFGSTLVFVSPHGDSVIFKASSFRSKREMQKKTLNRVHEANIPTAVQILMSHAERSRDCFSAWRRGTWRNILRLSDSQPMQQSVYRTPQTEGNACKT